MWKNDGDDDTHTQSYACAKQQKHNSKEAFMMYIYDHLPFAKTPTILPTYEITKYNKYIMMNG
jgi:hypothetical protein